MKKPELREMALADIRPYEGNPRVIPVEAVDAVTLSIQRYGYQQPIVVDTNGVIVVGHTRFLALQNLGYDKVEVYVTDMPEDKVKEYRLADNRTGELSTWDHDSLVLELREWEATLLDSFFPDIDLEVGTINDALTTQDDIDKATAKATSVKVPDEMLTTTVVCPSCFHEFKVRTDSLPGLSRADLKEIREG